MVRTSGFVDGKLPDTQFDHCQLKDLNENIQETKNKDIYSIYTASRISWISGKTGKYVSSCFFAQCTDRSLQLREPTVEEKGTK